MSQSTVMSISRRQDQREKQLLNQLEPLMHQPVQLFKGGGTYVQAGDKKIRLMGQEFKATLAGTVYYSQILGVRPPVRYDYNQ